MKNVLRGWALPPLPPSPPVSGAPPTSSLRCEPRFSKNECVQTRNPDVAICVPSRKVRPAGL